MKLIEFSKSSYAALILCVVKEDGQFRMVIDYRKLNSIAIADKYPLLLIEEIIKLANQCKYLTTIDLLSCFKQIYIHPEDKHKLAFITEKRLYQPIRLSFGYINSPAVFQRQYDTILGSMRFWARSYIDDLLIFKKNNYKRFNLKLGTILTNIYERNMSCNVAKTNILGKSIILLSIEVNGEGISLYIKDRFFEKLKNRKHTTIKDV